MNEGNDLHPISIDLYDVNELQVTCYHDFHSILSSLLMVEVVTSLEASISEEESMEVVNFFMVIFLAVQVNILNNDESTISFSGSTS